jgi:hypothetical protein
VVKRLLEVGLVGFLLFRHSNGGSSEMQLAVESRQIALESGKVTIAAQNSELE